MKEKSKGFFEDILNTAKEFVERHKGAWDHTKWEGLLSDIQKKGVSVTEEMSNTVGSVLESLKKLYTLFPKTEAMKEVKKEEEAAPKFPRTEAVKEVKKEEETVLKEGGEKASEEKKAVESKPKAPAKETEKITKEAYLKKLEDELKQWKAKIDILHADYDKAKEEHKEQYKKDFKEIMSLYKEGENILQKLKESSKEEWEELKDGADKVWSDIEGVIEKALTFEP